MEKIPAKIRVETLRELDALVGEHIIGETPEVYWEDAHSFFRFESEDEAFVTLKKFAKQLNLPTVDWESMEVVEVKSYQPYSNNIATAWMVAEKLAAQELPMKIWRERGMWRAVFGDGAVATALSAPVAICAAALWTKGVEVTADLDRLR